jgi:hypothetical protein
MYNTLMKRMVDLGEIEAHAFTPLEPRSIDLEVRELQDQDAAKAGGAVERRDEVDAGGLEAEAGTT